MASSVGVFRGEGVVPAPAMVQSARLEEVRYDVLADPFRDEATRSLLREARVARALREVAGALGASLELDELLDLVLGQLKELVEAESVQLFLLDERKRELVSRASGGSEERVRVDVGEGLLSYVARTGRTERVVEGVAQSREIEWDAVLGLVTRTAIVSPLKNNLSRTIGVLVAINKRTGPSFSDDDEEILSVLAKQAAIAIDNSRLLVTLIRKNQQLQQAQEQLTRRVRDLELMFELERSTAHAESHEKLARAVLERLARACNAEGAVLSLREGETAFAGEYTLTRAPRKLGTSEEPATFRATRVELADSVLAEVLAKNASLQLEFGNVESALGREALSSLIAEPLDGDDGPMGALGLTNKRTGPFTAEDLGLLRLVSANVSTAVRLFDASRAREREERLSSIGRLLSQVVHDLKSPLTVISGYVELMRDAESRDNRRKYAEEVLKQFQTLGAMQREVLAFARGETEVFSRKVLVDRYFEDLAELLAREVPEDRIRLTVRAEKKLIAHFDSERLTRAIQNLVRNAVEALQGPGHISVEAFAEGRDLVFRVSDDGPGIPEEIVPRLFQSFVTLGKKNGTGLGLAIVKRIALEHGGSVRLEARSLGASFLITLPGALRAAERARAVDVAPEGRALPAKKTSVVVSVRKTTTAKKTEKKGVTARPKPQAVKKPKPRAKPR